VNAPAPNWLVASVNGTAWKRWGDWIRHPAGAIASSKRFDAQVQSPVARLGMRQSLFPLFFALSYSPVPSQMSDAKLPVRLLKSFQ